MPTYYPIRWDNYSIRIIHEHFFRQIITIYSLANTEILPYFYSTWLSFNLMIRRHAYDKNIKELYYKWRLVKSENNEIVEGKMGEGRIKIHRWWLLNEKYHAIELKRISKQDQYKLQIEITDVNKTSPYFDILEFTIKDKDEYSLNLFWVIISAIIGAVVGGIVGSHF